MCRVIIYFGKQEVPLYDLLYGPDNSLAHQSYAPQLMNSIQNLAGLGFCAWSERSHSPDEPFYYKTTSLPFFDKNLHRLSKKITTNCFLAHVRGVEYNTDETVSEQNIHPYKLESSTLALAHNGNLAEMGKMKVLLKELIKPELFAQIKGTTDSEWIYATFLTMLEDYKRDVCMNEAWDAIHKTFIVLKEARQKAGIEKSSPVNLFITNGKYLIVTRFVFDFGCNLTPVDKAFLAYHSLWATFGEYYGLIDGFYKMQGSGIYRNIIFASEPLTTDRTSWIELPEYSITKAWLENDEIIFRINDLIL